MKNIVLRSISIALILSLTLLLMAGCDKNNADTNKSVSSKSELITKSEAYNIYYDTIKKYVPNIMTEPGESDVTIKAHEEVTYLDINFTRNLSVKIQSQNVDGKLQYCLLNQFPDANKMDFYCINDEKFYVASSFEFNGKGKLEERSYTRHMPIMLVIYLNSPLFEEEAITSLTSQKKGDNLEISFVVDGSNMEEGYPHNLMREIQPNANAVLDTVKIVLTLDKNSVPKTMSTELSMTKYYLNSDKIQAKKVVNSDFTFNKLDDVSFDFQEVVSTYVSDSSALQ